MTSLLSNSANDQVRHSIAGAVASRLERDQYLRELRGVTRPEIAAITERVVDAFAAWDDGQDSEVAACADYIAERCSARAIPLLEAAYAMYAIRDGLLAIAASESARCQGKDCRRLMQFFDALVLALLRQR